MTEDNVQTEDLLLERTGRRTYTGLVTSSANNKTITVSVRTMKKHPLYKKYMRRDKKVHVHDENNVAGAGDTVEVQEVTRKISKLKRYELVRIIERAK